MVVHRLLATGSSHIRSQKPNETCGLLKQRDSAISKAENPLRPLLSGRDDECVLPFRATVPLRPRRRRNEISRACRRQALGALQASQQNSTLTLEQRRQARADKRNTPRERRYRGQIDPFGSPCPANPGPARRRLCHTARSLARIHWRPETCSKEAQPRRVPACSLLTKSLEPCHS
jgi:hypothetical protein